jgi:hypothetical protein
VDPKECLYDHQRQNFVLVGNAARTVAEEREKHPPEPMDAMMRAACTPGWKKNAEDRYVIKNNVLSEAGINTGELTDVHQPQLLADGNVQARNRLDSAIHERLRVMGALKKIGEELDSKAVNTYAAPAASNAPDPSLSALMERKEDQQHPRSQAIHLEATEYICQRLTPNISMKEALFLCEQSQKNSDIIFDGGWYVTGKTFWKTVNERRPDTTVEGERTPGLRLVPTKTTPDR